MEAYALNKTSKAFPDSAALHIKCRDACVCARIHDARLFARSVNVNDRIYTFLVT